jgi:Phage integrase, N-terminal SAM-like domain
MIEKSISPLRQRMIDDMTARRFKEKVQKDYVRHVKTFAAFIGRSPDTATSEDLRRFQLHMARQQTLLRRPDDRHRNLRRRAPCALASAEPQQDRHLMSNAAVLTPLQPQSPATPANRRNGRPLPARRPQTLVKRRDHVEPPWRANQPSPLMSSKLTSSGERDGREISVKFLGMTSLSVVCQPARRGVRLRAHGGRRCG